MTTREHVILQGVLRGNGHEATCSVRALKVSMPGAGPPMYAQFSDVRTSSVLPPGVYQLHVNGQVLDIQYTGEFWIAA